MTRIVHISDLHFGKDRADLAGPLIETIAGLRADLVAISGDLTQRARVGQFAEARGFLDRLAPPVLVVPGNHDTPLDNFPLRLLAPWRRYRRAIGPDLEPRLTAGAVRVVGINTVDPYAWQRGRLSRRRAARACAALGDPPGPMNVAVLHHPLEQAGDLRKRPTSGAARALADLSRGGFDVVLSGHLHARLTTPFRAVPGMLMVQAGTSLSSRIRSEPNTFNTLDFARDRVEITAWAAEDTVFEPLECSAFEKSPEGWQRRA